MNAVQMLTVGKPEVLQLHALPEPALQTSTQVKVRIKAAGVNPIDTKIRARGLFFPDALPAVIGCDAAGIITEVGARVRHFKPGDEVYFCHGGLGREPGNYAQYCVIEAAYIARKPARADFIQAAAMPLAAITAWEALFDRANLQPAQSVLIHAGAGGVGHIAIQLAKHIGARVITTVSDTIKAEFVKSLGADTVIMYHTTDYVQAIKQLTGGRGVDVAFDTVGGEVFRQTINAVKHYGDLVTLLDPGVDIVWKEARTRNLRISFELMLTPLLRDLPEARAHQVDILNNCAQLVDRDDLNIHVSKVFPLGQAAQAHELLETGHTLGKLVLNTEA
ncbi:MAG: zinc-dependent alcohol dehydrogenase family protein [Gammaproteobacteria bacterium]|nr:zinc-dependent alcohol dehydrogenase family protein [Gammaproteobacteria bacterium]